MNSLVLFLFLTLSRAQSARILAAMPTVSKSHYASCRNVLLALAERHEVVVMSPFEEKDPPEGFKWVPIRIKSFQEALPHSDHNHLQQVSFFYAQSRLWDHVNQYTDYITNLTDVKNFIKNDQSEFDLVLAEDFFQQVFYAFAHKYKAPLVLLSSFGTAHYISEYMGNTVDPSYIPHEFATFFGEMSFVERFTNLVYTLYDVIGRKVMSLEHQDALAKALFGAEMPHVGSLEREAALVLLNSHFSVNAAQPLLPNMKEIAGAHIDAVKPLAEELKSVLDGAGAGAVLFSLGSLVELAKFPRESAAAVLKALGRLEQEVLVKWNSDEKPPLEFKNVHTFKWMPQNDILAHKNLIAFVTHGGLLSSQEAIHHGVPTVCIPFFGDQPLNCRRSVKMGYGRLIDKEHLTEDNVYDNIVKIIEDKSYRETVAELSRRFRDRPMSPLDTAVYWIEYVLRNKGDYMKSRKRNLYWFQTLYLDVMLTLLIMVLFVRKVVRKAFVLVFGKRKVKTN